MAANVGKTVLQRYFPVDVWPVLVPTFTASVLFGGMLTRIFLLDPENKGRLGAHVTDAEGSFYETQIKQIFEHRDGRSIFSNGPSAMGRKVGLE